MGNNRTVKEQAFAYKSMSSLLKEQDKENKFTDHKAKFVTPCKTIRCQTDFDDLGICVRIPWLFTDMPNKARVELMEYVMMRTYDVHAPLFGPRVRRFMKSDEFMTRYYYAAVYSGRKDILSVPSMDIHKWWSKVNKFWRYFTTEQWLKCKSKTEIRSRIRPSPDMPIVTVDPILRWIVIDSEVFYSKLTVEEQEFLIYFACCIWVAYDADHDELNLKEAAELLKSYPDMARILAGLEGQGYRLPFNMTSTNILLEKLPRKRTGCMFNKNTSIIKAGLEFNSRSAAAALALFTELDGKEFKNTPEQDARDQAIETYAKMLPFMTGDDGVVLIADKLGIKPDYYPWTENDEVSYTFGFELLAGDVPLGRIQEMKLTMHGTVLRVKTAQFTVNFENSGASAFRAQMESKVLNQLYGE